MKTEFETFTRPELEERGEAFLWPADPAAVELMPGAIWELVRSHPDLAADVPVATALSIDGVRVASMALISQPLRIGGREYPCVTGHSLFSHPDRRAAGVGGLLLRELLAHLAARNLPFSAYGATPYANRLMTALRMANVGLAARWVMPLRSGPILRRHVRSAPLAWAAAACANPLLRSWSLLQRARLRPSAAGLSLEEVDSFGDVPEVDAAGAPRAHVRRGCAYLNWKLRFVRRNPAVRGRAFRVLDGSGATAGHFLLRVATHERVGSQEYRDVRVCRVLDLARPASDEAARSAVYHLLRLAARERADVLEVLTSDPHIGAACRSAGFRRSNGYELMISRTKALPEEAYSLDNWFLTMVESESAFF